MRLPNLQTTAHYFVIDSIGGMNEGYSETICRRITDALSPEYGKAMVEEYIDQWIHDRLEYYVSAIAQTGATFEDPVKYNLEEHSRGEWVKLTPEFDKNLDPNLLDELGYHTLCIHANRWMTLKTVLVYDQINDKVLDYYGSRSTAIRIAEEVISVEVEGIKTKVHTDRERGYKLFGFTSLLHAYDSLADVVRCLEHPQKPQSCMIDIDDRCLHFFPVQAIQKMTYDDDNRIS